MENNLKIEKAGLYTIAKLQNFGITENQIQDYRVNVIVEMTPEIAREILETNTNNRNATQSRIACYANDMVQGRWDLNGETIKIDSNGRLLDGQNRLMAVVKCGLTVLMEISYGLPYTTFNTIDTGKNRTAGDIVSIYGATKSSGTIATALKVVIDYERGRQVGASQYTTHPTSSNIHTSGASGITNQDIEKAWERHGNIVGYIPAPKDIRTIGHRALFTALHYLFSLSDKELADRFFDNLYHGEYNIGGRLYRSLTVKTLRETLIDMYAHRDKKGNNNNRIIASLTIKAWNAFVNDKDLKKIKIADGEKQQPILGIDGKQMRLVV